MGKQGGDRSGGLVGEAPGFKVGGHKAVGAVVEHALGELLGVDGGLDLEVPEHGVRFPAAEEHDGIAVDVGTEEGRGPAGAEGAGRHLGMVDAGDGFDGLGGMPKGIGDVGGFDVVPFVVVRMRVVMVVERRGGRRARLFEAESEAPERFARAEDGVGAGPVTDLFTAHRILLVTELEGCGGDAIHIC